MARGPEPPRPYSFLLGHLSEQEAYELGEQGLLSGSPTSSVQPWGSTATRASLPWSCGHGQDKVVYRETFPSAHPGGLWALK